MPLEQDVLLAMCAGNRRSLETPLFFQYVHTFLPSDSFPRRTVNIENFLSVYFPSPEKGRFVSGNSGDISHAGLEHLETIYVNVPKAKMQRFICNSELEVQTMLVFLARDDCFPVILAATATFIIYHLIAATASHS